MVILNVEVCDGFIAGQSVSGYRQPITMLLMEVQNQQRYKGVVNLN